jgi:hypothetical protein
MPGHNVVIIPSSQFRCSLLFANRLLLEDLAVGPTHWGLEYCIIFVRWGCLPVIFLATDLDWLVPRPHVVDKGLVLLALGVELGEAVGLVVGGDLESGKSFLSADEECALDNGVVGDAEDGAGTE